MDTNSPWHYFNRTAARDVAVCKQCTKKIKAVGGSTSGLHGHLKSQHNINLLKRRKEKSDDTSTSIQTVDVDSRSKITSYLKKTSDESFPAVVARMTARDGIPFSKFCTSQDLRMLLIAKGYGDIPKSPNTIKNIVLQYADKIKQEVVHEISQLKLSNEAFSLTLDEWTSNKNRRYMNINVHRSNNKFWNLGLCRIRGSMSAERCVIVIKSKLKEFGISLANIVSLTTDGASVMKKTIKLIDANHQLCLVHGIQLAVIKVLYNKNNTDAIVDEDQEPVELPDTNDYDNSDDDNDEDIENNGEGLEVVQNMIIDSHLNPLRNVQLNSLITKIRKVVKIFRKSPTKNDDTLQKHVKEQFGKEFSLILDSKTRWNSLLAMLERFSMLKSCIRKSLIDLKSEINFTDIELTLLSDTILALQPIKLAVETLCSENVNLYIADVTLKFMLDELMNQHTLLSNELKNALIQRIKERRTSYSDVLQYLSHYNVKKSNEEDYGIFNKTNKSTIRKIIEELIERVYNKNETSTELSEISSDSDSENSVNVMPSTSTRSLKEKLHFLIKAKTEVPAQPTLINKKNKSMSQVIKKELTYFHEENVKGKYIQLAYDFLMTTRPTSVESERAFSAAGLFCTKIRSRLGDESLNKLCFLRAYLLKSVDK